MHTLDSFPPLDEHEASAASEALFEAARPLFAGHNPKIVGIALAQLTALWLAGFQAPDDPDSIDDFRADVLQMHTTVTLELTPMMEAEFIKPRMRARG